MNTQTVITDHLAQVFAQSAMDEVRFFLENNAILDEDGNEIEIDPRDFDFEVSVRIK